MQKLLRVAALWALSMFSVTTLLAPAGPASAVGSGRAVQAGPILCHGNECNGKMPSANGCVTDGHALDEDLLYRIAAFEVNDPGHRVYGNLYYSGYCDAVFGEYITDDPNDTHTLGIYRMNNYGGVEQGWTNIVVTADGTYRTPMVGYSDNQAKFCAQSGSSDPDMVGLMGPGYPCTGWR